MTRIHLSLRTADLVAATAFYTELLGAPPDKVRDGYVRFAPEGTPILLSLMPGEPAVDHFGLRLSDLAEAGARSARLGLELASEVVCCHAEKAEVWLKDPDGRAWEVYTVTDEQPEALATGGCCVQDAPAAPSCCP